MKIQPKAVLCLLMLGATLFLFNYGCRKTSDTEKTPEQQIADQQSTVDKFLALPSNAIPLSQKIVANLRRQNSVNLFIPEFAERYGFPLWDKATRHPTPKKRGASGGANREGDVPDEQVLVPLVREGSEVVYSALACRIIGDSVTVRLLDAGDYAAFNQDSTTSGINGRQLSLMLMNLNKEVYGYDRFIINDSAAFGGLGKRVHKVKINSSSAGEARLILWQIRLCVTIMVPNNEGQVTGCPGGTPDCPQVHEETYCEDFYYYADDGTGTGGGTGTGTGSGGGGDGGGNGPGHPCGPSGGRLIANGRVAPPCGGGGGTGGGGGSNPPPVWVPENLEIGVQHFDNWFVSEEDLRDIRYWRNNNIDTTGLDTCFKKIYEKLMANATTSLLGQMFTKMERSIFEKNNITKFKVKFLSENMADTTIVGKAGDHSYDPVSGIFSTTIRLNLYYKNRTTELDWLNTIMHEMMHSYLQAIHYRYYYTLNPGTIQSMDFGGLFTSYIDTLLARNTRAGISNYMGANNQMDHNHMADYILNAFADALERAEGSTIANKRYYWFMAWGGLHKTKTWLQHWPNYPHWPPANPAPSEDSTRGLKYALTLSRIDSITQALKNEQQGLPGALGKPKIPGACY